MGFGPDSGPRRGRLLDSLGYGDALRILSLDCCVHKKNLPAPQVLLGWVQIDDGRMMAS